MIQEIEEWKQIEDSDYFISSFGNVESTKYGKHKILKAGVNSSGYKQVLLTINNKKKSYTIHQLVAVYFLNHTINGYKHIINHKDNLEITTQRINSNKQHIKSSSKYTGVYWSKEKQQWIASIKIKNKRTYLGAFDNELDAGKAYQEEINNL